MKKKICSRNVDELGRIVLPQEVGTALEIEKNDTLDVSIDKNAIILRKHEPCCVLCRSTEALFKQVNEKLVCDICVALLVKDS